MQIGLANFFIMHTSASLTLNENASPDVPLDLSDDLERIVPERRDYRHLDEGMDDMPAHTKVTACENVIIDISIHKHVTQTQGHD